MRTKILGLLCISFNFIHAANFSGKYLCNGHDTKDGAYKNDYVTLTGVMNKSNPNKDLYSYLFELTDAKGVVQYTGFAASNADNLAIYFENVDKKSANTKEDRGVGIARVQNITIKDKDGKEKLNTTFKKFYFEPTYSSTGLEFCKKI